MFSALYYVHFTEFIHVCACVHSRSYNLQLLPGRLQCQHRSWHFFLAVGSDIEHPVPMAVVIGDPAGHTFLHLLKQTRWTLGKNLDIPEV